MTGDAAPQSVGECVTLACLWEATAAKPGNVHRGADFEGLTFADFVASSVAVGRSLGETASQGGVGASVLSAVTAMNAAVATNTHLGTVLLLAPISIAADGAGELRTQLRSLIEATTVADAEAAYAAIRLASPSGLGEVADADVAEPATVSLVEAMRLAADRDLIARQYANGFGEVFAVTDAITSRIAGGNSLHDAIVITHIELMSREPDSLIARKCGPAVAQESADRAAEVMAAGAEASDAFWQAAGDLDFWLRADGHRRNPGTTADVIAAALFVLLVEQRLSWPVRFYSQDA